MDTEILKPRYEAQIKEYLLDVLQVFQQNGIDVEAASDGDCWDGDTRWSLVIEPEDDDNGAELAIQIIASDNGWDAPERDGLNVMAEMVSFGGRPLAQIIPMNFTDDAWVNPENLPELDRRLADVLSCPVSEWLGRYIPAPASLLEPA